MSRNTCISAILVLASLIVLGSCCGGILWVAPLESDVRREFTVLALIAGGAIVLTTIVSIIILVLTDRKVFASEPICTSCGYRLQGNTSGKCSECGQYV